ncbi:MAG: acyl-CoA dehydrogenase, partial [Calditrichaeota bacterium]
TAEWMSAYCLTEPTAGSDAMSLRTTATPSEDGSHYILNGTKQFITNGGWADVYIVFAKVNGEKMTAFIVERNTPGVQVGKEEYKLGQKGASTTSITFENVAVPKENILHEIGKGAEVAFNSLNIGRFKLGAADLGGCKAVIKEAVAYTLERWQFGQPIAYFDALKRKFAEMVVNTYAMESILYRTAGMLDDSISQVAPDSPNYFSEVANAIESNAIECSICKIFGSETLWKSADDGLQMFGGYGFVEDYPMARLLRDARIERLYEGTNEINRQVITGYFLKKTILEILPIRETIQRIPKIAEGELPAFDGVLKNEMQALELAKAAALLLFHHALVKYGQDVLNEQQLGEVLSNLFIDLYVMDTTLNRVKQHPDAPDENDVRVKIARVLCGEKIPELFMRVEESLYAILNGKSLEQAIQRLTQLKSHLNNHYNLFQLKREIAEELYHHQEYWL